MKQLIEYQTRTGRHCGSTAMRSLLLHYCQIDLSESMVVGLGSAPDCVVIENLPGVPMMSFGRGLTMEVDCAAALGVGYVERADLDDARAWQTVRAEVRAGRPTMLSGDTYHLSYHPNKNHFPSHRFVLVGFDDEAEIAWIMDNRWTEVQACPYAELAASRNPRDWLISTYNRWGQFTRPNTERSLAEACRRALRQAADRLLCRDNSHWDAIVPLVQKRGATLTSGLAGIARLRAILPETLRAPGARFLAKVLGNTYELRGTGGGNFRRFYGEFLREADGLDGLDVPPDAIAAADRSAQMWTTLAQSLIDFGKGGDARPDTWTDALDEIHAAESDLARALDQLAQPSAP